jgi:hypothetical protein
LTSAASAIYGGCSLSSLNLVIVPTQDSTSSPLPAGAVGREHARAPGQGAQGPAIKAYLRSPKL